MIAKSTRDKARRQRALNFINASKKSARCIHCDLADPRCIEFHHWNPDSKAFGISEAIRLRMTPDKIAREMAKCVAAYCNCQAILLANNNTDTAWFQRAVAAATSICFPRGRIHSSVAMAQINIRQYRDRHSSTLEVMYQHSCSTLVAGELCGKHPAREK